MRVRVHGAAKKKMKRDLVADAIAWLVGVSVFAHLKLSGGRYLRRHRHGPACTGSTS